MTTVLSAALAIALVTSPAPEAAGAAAAPRAATADPFAPLGFLDGEWIGETGETPGEGTESSASFRRELDGRILVRRSRFEYASNGQAKSTVHEELLVVHPSQEGLRAVCFDNDGHVIEYAIEVQTGRVAFESDASRPGPRYRLVYDRRSSREIGVTFLIAPPGKPFATYVSRIMRRP